MVSIAAHNRDVERSLQKNIKLAEQDGAEFSDDLLLKCVDGSLSLEAPADSAGKVLIRLPWDCLIPLQSFQFSVIDDNIIVSSHDEGLTSSCVARMEAILELYNLTNKFAYHRRTSPWLLIASHPRLQQYVVQRRSGIASEYGKFIHSGTRNELLLRTFLNTRAYTSRVDFAQARQFPVLMPVLDLMNHHIYGAAYPEDQDTAGRSITMRRSAPIPGTGTECFACYGPYDSFETWITYNFIDGRVPFVTSVAMTIDLPGLGTIRLANFHKLRFKKDLPDSVKYLWAYIPQLLAKREHHMETASLLIPGHRAPKALRQTLRFLISEISPAHSQTDLVLHAEDQIIAANNTYYRSLMAFLQTLSAEDPLQKPILDEFIRLCELQLARLQVYVACAEG
jgi:hypothetical protein